MTNLSGRVTAKHRQRLRRVRRSGLLRPWSRRLEMEQLEERDLLAVASCGPFVELASGTPAHYHGEISFPEAVDCYEFQVPEPGRVVISVRGDQKDEYALDTKVRLIALAKDVTDPLDPEMAEQIATVLMESDDRAPGDVNPLLDLHLGDREEGDVMARYRLSIEASPAADERQMVGEYQLSIEFQPASPPFEPVEIEGAPLAVVTGQFNDDNDDGVVDARDFLDVASANGTTDDVSILLGRGDGTFALQPESIPVGVALDRLAGGDFDGDGHFDLIAVHDGSNDIWVLRGDGDGSFAPEGHVAALPTDGNPHAVIPADLNDDEYLDLAIAMKDDTVRIYYNNGQGEFEEPRADFDVIHVGDNPRGLIAVDLDDDGDVDLATANRDDGSVSVLLQTDGIFELQTVDHQIHRAFGLTSGDFDLDGDLDLAVTGDKAVPGDKSTKVTVLLGSGTGEFTVLRDSHGKPVNFPVGNDTENIIAEDLNGDGFLDLVASNESHAGSLSVLLNRGDRTARFEDQIRVMVGSEPQAPVAGQFNDDNGDGVRDDRDFVDLAVPNRESSDVSILLGRGDGAFFTKPGNLVGENPGSIAVGDLNDDDRLDVVTANRVSDDVSVLIGLGNGAFQPTVHYDVGSDDRGQGPWAIAVADLDGDGNQDVVTANYYSNDVTVLWGEGGGSFQPAVGEDGRCASCFAVGDRPTALVVADVIEDASLELITRNEFSNDYSLLVGAEGRTFLNERRITKEELPREAAERFEMETTATIDEEWGRFNPDSVLVADLDHDEHADLVVAADLVHELSVRLGRGDGTFGSEKRVRTPLGDGPHGLAAGQFDDDNNDGTIDDHDHLDVVVVHHAEDAISVFHGDGRGSFPTVTTIDKSDEIGDLFHRPEFIVSDDFNDDGQGDLMVANGADASITVLIGTPDGTFEPATMEVGSRPVGLAVGDFDHNGKADVAVLNRDDKSVSLLLGDGTGSFQSQTPVTIANGPSWKGEPRTMVAGQFSDDNGDGVIDKHDDLDLAIGNEQPGSVHVMLGDGSGSMVLSQIITDGIEFARPRGLTSADLNHDGFVDLAVTDDVEDAVRIFLGTPSGQFELRDEPLPVGPWPSFLTAADVDHDQWADLVAVNKRSQHVTVLHNDHDAEFSSRDVFVGTGVEPTVVGDLNGDGSDDQAMATRDNRVVVDIPIGVPGRLGVGPLTSDVNGDGLTEVVTVDRNGEILLRLGERDGGSPFSSPSLVRVGHAAVRARDVAIVKTAELTKSDVIHLAVLTRDKNEVVLYAVDFTGDAQPGPTLETGANPSRLVAHDMDGDRDDDLVVLNAGDGTVSVFIQEPAGDFRLRRDPVKVGQGPWDLQLLETAVGQGTRTDILLVNRQSNDLSLLVNDGDGNFTEHSRTRAGTLVIENDVSPVDGRPKIVSTDEASGIATGDFNRDGYVDVVVTSAVARRAAIVYGKPSETFADPNPILLPGPASGVLSSDLNGDGFQDLLFLHEASQQISILLGKDDGRFEADPAMILEAGNAPVGLSLADLDGDARSDLLVQNQFGDILVFSGTADGLFQQSFSRADQSVTLAVSADGSTIVTTNRARDKVFILSGEPQPTAVPQATGLSASGALHSAALLQPTAVLETAGLFAPEAVLFADLNGDRLDDLIVANGGNTRADDSDILVYLGLPSRGVDIRNPLRVAGEADPLLAGNSVGITSADVDEDGDNDLIVTSFDLGTVSVLVNDVIDDHGRPIPRFRATGQLDVGLGPVSPALRDVIGDDGVDDLLLTNRLEGTVRAVKGLGSGRYDDKNPVTIVLGGQTAARGAMFGIGEGFALLADGRIVSFSYDAFRSEQPMVRPVHFRSGSEPKDQFRISAMRLVQRPVGGLTSELYIIGLQNDDQPFLARFELDGASNLVERERFSSDLLRGAGDFQAAFQPDGSIEYLVSLDDLQGPALRIVARAFLPLLSNAESQVIAFTRVPALTGSGIVEPFQPPMQMIPPHAGGPDGGDGSDSPMIGILTALVRGFTAASEGIMRVAVLPLLAAMEDTLGKHVPNRAWELFADALGIAVDNALPHVPSVPFAWRAITEPSAVMKLAEMNRGEASDASAESLEVYSRRGEEMYRQSFILAQVARWLARHLGDLDSRGIILAQRASMGLTDMTMCWLATPRSSEEPSIDQAPERIDRAHPGWNIVSVSLTVVGAAGLAWHRVGKRRLPDLRWM